MPPGWTPNEDAPQRGGQETHFFKTVWNFPLVLRAIGGKGLTSGLPAALTASLMVGCVSGTTMACPGNQGPLPSVPELRSSKSAKGLSGSDAIPAEHPIVAALSSDEPPPVPLSSASTSAQSRNRGWNRERSARSRGGEPVRRRTSLEPTRPEAARCIAPSHRIIKRFLCGPAFQPLPQWLATPLDAQIQKMTFQKSFHARPFEGQPRVVL